MNNPALKDWKNLLQQDLERIGNKKDDILKVISICNDYSKEIESVRQWIAGHQRFVDGVMATFDDLYRLRFNSEPVRRPELKMALTQQILLNTPKIRAQEIRKIALATTQIGTETDCVSIQRELERRGMKLEGNNPNAIISTILNGSTSGFKKVGKGVFKRTS
jgi:hypothetical protein